MKEKRSREWKKERGDRQEVQATDVIGAGRPALDWFVFS